MVRVLFSLLMFIGIFVTLSSASQIAADDSAPKLGDDSAEVAVDDAAAVESELLNSFSNKEAIVAALREKGLELNVSSALSAPDVITFWHEAVYPEKNGVPSPDGIKHIMNVFERRNKHFQIEQNANQTLATLTLLAELKNAFATSEDPFARVMASGFDSLALHYVSTMAAMPTLAHYKLIYDGTKASVELEKIYVIKPSEGMTGGCDASVSTRRASSASRRDTGASDIPLDLDGDE